MIGNEKIDFFLSGSLILQETYGYLLEMPWQSDSNKCLQEYEKQWNLDGSKLTGPVQKV